ncbi:MAG: hypothetical protein AAF687_14185 [Pseudomonadota bacterium]
MKLAPLAAALVIGSLTTPVMAADGHAEKAEAKKAMFTVDQPIEKLAADPRSKAVLDKHLPGFDQHPAYDQFKSMSLKAIAPFSQGAITEDMLKKISADLAAIK